MVPKCFDKNDLVWAKMRGYPPWPGKISVPPKDDKLKKAHHYVFFYASENYAWIPDEAIELHDESLVEKYTKNQKRTATYMNAVQLILAASKSKPKYVKNSENSNVKTSRNQRSKTPNANGVVIKVKVGGKIDKTNDILQNLNEVVDSSLKSKGLNINNMSKQKEIKKRVAKTDSRKRASSDRSSEITPAKKQKNEEILASRKKSGSFLNRQQNIYKLTATNKKIENDVEIDVTSKQKNEKIAVTRKRKTGEVTVTENQNGGTATTKMQKIEAPVIKKAKNCEIPVIKKPKIFKVPVTRKQKNGQILVTRRQKNSQLPVSRKQKKYEVDDSKKRENDEITATIQKEIEEIKFSRITSTQMQKNDEITVTAKQKNDVMSVTRKKKGQVTDAKKQKNEVIVAKKEETGEIAVPGKQKNKVTDVIKEKQDELSATRKQNNIIDAKKQKNEKVSITRRQKNVLIGTFKRRIDVTNQKSKPGNKKQRNNEKHFFKKRQNYKITGTKQQNNNEMNRNLIHVDKNDVTNIQEQKKTELRNQNNKIAATKREHGENFDIKTQANDEKTDEILIAKTQKTKGILVTKQLGITVTKMQGIDDTTNVKNFEISDTRSHESDEILVTKNLEVDDFCSKLQCNVPSDCISIPEATEISNQNNIQIDSSALNIDRPESPSLDVNSENEILKLKEIIPTEKKIGFLGLGRMGQRMVKNLIQSGHSVTIWNRTASKCEKFTGVEIAQSPADVVMACDIIFCCLADTAASKSVFFGNCGVLSGLRTAAITGESKGFVEMTTLDPDTSKAIYLEVNLRRGRYLEAQLHGTKEQSNDGTLLIVAAGDKSLFEDCHSCFLAMGKTSLLVSEQVGTASTYNIIHNMLYGTVYTALAESLALIESCSLEKELFIDTFMNKQYNSVVHLDKEHSMGIGQCSVNTPLKHIQKCVNSALSLGSSVAQPMHVNAAANEVYKHCKLLKYDNLDISAVYEGAKR